ncbi:hypothetical protein C0Q90_16370, partial [Lacticaseibacillus paracasei]
MDTERTAHAQSWKQRRTLTWGVHALFQTSWLLVDRAHVSCLLCVGVNEGARTESETSLGGGSGRGGEETGQETGALSLSSGPRERDKRREAQGGRKANERDATTMQGRWAGVGAARTGRTENEG